ncbi:VirB3 family type IV secretion system protein [Fusobacterium sp. PH5-44]|uniref:VirB3 family type IV secretion system protein n=1 Tax=unclassified Fusobacterium TaxID=2648384 RepID=UPI003D1BB0BE
MRRKVPKALTTDILIAGGARTPVMINGIIAFCLPFANWKLLFIPIILHIFIVRATKKDPKFFDIIKRMTRYRKRYES